MFYAKKRKLRFDILTIFLSLFLSTVLTIIYYSQTRSNAAILEVADDLITRSHQAIIEKMQRFLTPAPFIQTAQFLLKDELLDISDMDSLSTYIHIVLQSYPQLNSVYFADKNGNMFMESRFSDSTADKKIVPFIQQKVIPADTAFISAGITQAAGKKRLFLNYRNMEGLTLKSENDPYIDYDPRTRPWFIGAKKSGKEPWIGIYEFYGAGRHGMTVASAIFVGKHFAGIAAADLSLDLITNELKRYSIDSKGIVFIINNTGNLITQNLSSQIGSIKETKDPLIRKAYDMHHTTGKNAFIFQSDNTSYIANFTPYALNENEIWQIASVIPADIFTGAINRVNHHTMMFSFFMLLFGIGLIIYSSHKISVPIMRVAEETKNMIQFQLDKPTLIKTHIYEVQILIDALNATKSALSSFAKYVPKALVEQLLHSNIIAQVGGTKRDITVLFTDIANFTEVAEKSDPELLMTHMSEYLNSLTESIHRHRGNIDKYIGDAIMAFWGTPLDDARHAFHACNATLACRHELDDMNALWSKTGKPVFPTRFGINSGEAIVGNMGSNDRLNYTALGDNVNLAARLETLNKIYQTEIIVSDSVYDSCSNDFLFRPLDRVQVKGRSQPTTIFELVAGTPDSLFPPTEQQVTLCQMTWKAYEAYQQSDFALALSLYQAIAKAFPQDEVARIYIERCK